MATLATYTQALQHIATQDILDYEYTHLPATEHLNPFSELFLRVEVAEWKFTADDATHVYRIQYPEGNDLFGTMVYAEYMRDVEPATVAVSLRLLPDTAAEIVRAVLAELDTHETKPDKSYTLAQLDAMRSSMYTPKDFKVKDYFGAAISPEREALARINQVAAEYAANTYWREGEGNNP